MSTATKARLTDQEYLAIERKAQFKSEFLNGEVFAMAGGTRRHSLIAINLAGELRALLENKPGQVFNSDMRLKIQATGLHTYPDVQVAGGILRFEDQIEDILLNPKIIAEVRSESTASWDRGQKFWHYRHVESLQEYVLVSQDLWLVEHYLRQPNGAWLLQTIDDANGALRLDSIECSISLTEIYAKTGVQPGAIPSSPSK